MTHTTPNDPPSAGFLLPVSVVTNTTLGKYPMQINEITHGMPTFQAQLKLSGSTVTTRLQVANIQQARALLVHLYGAANVVALTLVSE